jgi:hypothetical protein
MTIAKTLHANGNGDRSELFKSVGGVPLAEGNGHATWYFGWIPRDPAVDAHLRGRELKFFGESANHLVGSGANKTVLLYEAVRQVWGRDLDIGPQLIGDCVSWGYSGCVDLIACIEVIAGEAEEHSWELRTCTEAMYALSRVEYGDLDGSSQDGSRGLWASAAVSAGGTLSREVLGPYNPTRAKAWGATGLPDDLEPEARTHRIRRTTLVQTFEEARDSIANGYPIAVCSGQGFSMDRDNDGFASANDSWAHCMKFIASRDDERPGLLCMNSWGDVHTGPKGKHDIPDGSFWVDAEVCTNMFQSWMDSYALSQFDGYPRRAESLASLVA